MAPLRPWLWIDTLGWRGVYFFRNGGGLVCTKIGMLALIAHLGRPYQSIIPYACGIHSAGLRNLSARMRNMRLIQEKIVEGIPEKVDTLCDLDRGCPTPRSGSQ